jgi:hypothetical protein
VVAWTLLSGLAGAGLRAVEPPPGQPAVRAISADPQGADTRPEIWFAPEDSIRRAERGDPWKGDFFELFPADAPWQAAAARVQVFEIYPQFVARASDDNLRTVIEGLERRHIALAYSCGMLHRPAGGKHHEGYGAEESPAGLARVKRLGGEVRYAVADEPLYFGHFYQAPGAIPVSITEIAQDLAATALAFRKVFPRIRVGMEDPIMAYTSQEEWIAAMRELLKEYRKTFGEPMGCVRLENANYAVREWMPRFVAAAQFLKSENVPFGILVTGDSDDTSDADWFGKAEERYVAYESDGRPAAEQMVFQSWMPRPTRILPETVPGTHTHFLNGYFRSRTALTATREPDRLSGRLSDDLGRPLAGQRVSLAVLPGFDDPAMTRRTIAGVVPEAATTARIGLRIGLEGSRAAAARLTLGEVHYGEAADRSRTTTLSFNQGWKGWGKLGTATTELEAAGGGDNQVLNVDATAGQTLLLNSKTIAVTPGHEFRFDFDLHLKSGTETGFLIVFFFDRSAKALAHWKEPLLAERPRWNKDLFTDAAGRWEAAARSPELQQAREIWLTYPGDQHRRPARVRLR